MLDIRNCITSNDVKVLEQSLTFVKQRAAREVDRGKAAETRATAMLAVLGVFTGLIVPRIESLANIAGDSRWFLLVVFLSSLLFLVRGLVYAIKVLSVGKQYQATPETVYDFQKLSYEDVLREEITTLLWECRQATRPNTEKLFWLNRCQRSGFIAISLFLVFGTLLVPMRGEWLSLPLWASACFGILTITLLFFGDRICEHFGEIWEYSNVGSRRSDNHR